MKIMAVDLGDARTGLAACDRTEMLASPLGVIHERKEERLLEQVANAAKEFAVGRVVIGHPVNMDGSAGERAHKAEAFADRLREMIEADVVLWDERSTTVSAHQILNTTDTRGKRRKEVVDEVAATLILDSYLAYRKNHPEERSV